jgi:hypothetical protein
MAIRCKKFFSKFGFILAGQFIAATVVFAEPPAQITFSNLTDLALSTSIAGLPGQGIAPSVVKPVSYNIVNMACTFYRVVNNCPIEFTDKTTGAKVATVYINAATATLTQAPTFYGNYANLYEVKGWDASPITEISIVSKA